MNKSPTQDVRLGKADKREEDARVALAVPKRAHRMLNVLTYFTMTVRGIGVSDEARQRVERELPGVLSEIHDLGLMTLPEHRSAVAGAIVATVHLLLPDTDRPDDLMPILMKDVQDRFATDQFRLISACERMTPSTRNEEITRPQQVEWLWMAWAVTRQPALLTRLCNLAHRKDEVGTNAYVLLAANATDQDVADGLQRLQREMSDKLQPASANVQTKMAVSALRLLLTASPIWKRQIILVGWFPSDLDTKGSYVVVTPDGNRPPLCPTVWRTRPVLVRKPTIQERLHHQALLASHEDI